MITLTMAASTNTSDYILVTATVLATNTQSMNRHTAKSRCVQYNTSCCMLNDVLHAVCSMFCMLNDVLHAVCSMCCMLNAVCSMCSMLNDAHPLKLSNSAWSAVLAYC